ncbi:SRPBCC family protein [Shewanella frigidimarina]|uniref:Cyclase/dehydrase n=3 Tax=Shewanella TaxID=22 RepID=Q085W7_SHEFN|nr:MULTISPECIES: SRPBCC family protein [Shewanella]ABI70948.1 cyclase/dehydrase [Shewanella frigidimarina NCIMB 400]MBB1427634.1 ubiquinone-binding protein [Shewanella sp. SG44-2]RPA23168.1 ubiquinone-binding protein [Shewanella frigidimarina]RPA62921.1 ubiquinone-binding protein [Shewanella frigidimarina]|tara:strand:- start:305 stop:739 length:435 start_codon:yes stop_codon:yes gene_type:complete
MPKISKSMLVRFSALQMYDLVNDVESYHAFLPGCVGGKVLEFDGQTMVASVDVSKAGISKTFTTRNQVIQAKSISLELENGPFKHMHGLWKFTELTEDACKVEFDLDFEFSNMLVDMAFGKVFKDLMSSMVMAFTDRAKVIYRD